MRVYSGMPAILFGALLLSASFVFQPAAARQQGGSQTDWPSYGGGSDGIRYSSLTQIDRSNVSQLQVAWTYDSGEGQGGTQSQPLVAGGVLYAVTPKHNVVALDAATGKPLWRFESDIIGRGANRGVAYWTEGSERRIFAAVTHFVYALDAATGTPIPSFGTKGRIDLREGLGRDPAKQSIILTTPGVIYKDMLIVGGRVSEGLPCTPGDIRAYDVRTGQMRWAFHTIPRPGEFGYKTWPRLAWKVSGSANNWAGMTVDAVRGLVFVPTGSAASDFYGADRVGDDLFANTMLALDANTGKRIWHFQAVKHDIWDRDFPSQPALVRVKRGRKWVDAVAQTTKSGHVYVFERRNGKPLFPIAERRVPASTLDGERAAESQPYPVKPPPFVRQQLTESMLTTRTPEARVAALKIFNQFKTSGMYDPPNLEGKIIFPGVDGGGEWGGPAFDPGTGLLYVNANEMPWLNKLVPRSDKSLYGSNCATCHGDDLKGTAEAPTLVDIGARRTKEQLAQLIAQGTGRMPAFRGALDDRAISAVVNFLLTGKDAADTSTNNPFVLKYRSTGLNIFLDPDGFPAITPPWGTLNAIDLNAGTIRWSIPFGEYPKLVAQGIRRTGSDNYGGAIVTANGLLIIGATTYDNKFHIYDKKTGALLWEATLPAAGNATPSIYMVGGREYIVIACGGGKNDAPSGGTYVAFSLPERARNGTNGRN